jgi:DNA-binding HxlR family transcriptional regulator
MGMEATSLTRTLKSMEDRGLIIRKKSRRWPWCIDLPYPLVKERSKNTVLKFNEAVKKKYF